MARPTQDFHWIYQCVELAKEAGYNERQACKLLSNFFPSRHGEPDLSEEFLRNNYRAYRGRHGRIIDQHRAEHLKDFAAKHLLWVEHLQKNPAPLRRNRLVGKNP